LSAQDYSFPDDFRLQTPADFKSVFNDPVRSVDKYFTVLATRNPLPYPRLGLAIAKKTIRKAVARNRIKRTVRESFRLQRQQLVNIDIVVLARGDAATAAAQILRKSLERHWLKLVDRATPTNNPD
jgi:ribonuclease P protein component